MPMSPEHLAKMADGRRAAAERRRLQPKSETQERIAAQPQPEVLGTIPTEQLTDTPAVDWSTRWISADGTVYDLREMPPWMAETARRGRSALDARTFVDYPETWVTRWQHPDRIKVAGYRDWMPMMASHPSVTVKVRQMVGPDNQIRMGLDGPILCFMPREWWERKQALKRQDMLHRTVGKVDTDLNAFTEDVARGKYGRHVKPYDKNHRGSFPSNPAFDGRTVRQHDPT